MILYFLRHGRAEDAHGGPDAERHLTKAGKGELRNAAPLWRRLKLRPDLVLTSPLTRAVETAELACLGLGLKREPLADDRLSPGASWPQLAQAMAEHPAAARVLFVGHQPDLGSAMELLSGASSVRLRPGGMGCLEFPGVPEPGQGEIVWLLDSDLYTDE